MTTSSPPSADQKIIERLALFMGYKYPTNPVSVEVGDIESFDSVTRTLYAWKSESEMIGLAYLDDWNHWRQVEEKVMETETLLDRFLLMFDPQPHQRSIVKPYMKADLPTRCNKLIQALDSLPPKA